MIRNAIAGTHPRLWREERARVEPHLGVAGRTHRDVPAGPEGQNARFLAGLLFIIVTLGSLSGVVQLALVPGFLPTFIAIFGALAVLATAYVFARTTRYRVAGWLVTFAPVAACAAVVVQNPDDHVWYGFMLVGVLLASAVLSLRATAFVALLAFSLTAALVAAIPEPRDPSHYLPPLMFQAVFSPLLLLSAYHRQQLEQKRAHLSEQLRESSRLETVGRLAGGGAHDFNNLLTVIYANAELIQHTAPEDQHGLVDEILAISDRATRLTGELVAFASRQVLEPKVLDPGAVLDGVTEMLRRLIGSGIELRLLRAAEVGPVKADPTQLEQVVLNLVFNAREAMPDGGILTIELTEQSFQGAPHVRLAVSDTGQGMDKETLSHVFEPFFTTRARGSGLGLATVYGIVKQSGGDIRVASTLGKGTRFEVTLSRVDESLSPLEADTKVGDTPSMAGSTVLVVDDNGGVRDSIGSLLTLAGFRVLTAESGRDALDRFGRGAEGIDLVITDLVMPEMGGEELAKRLWQRRPEIEVLFVSGYSTDVAKGETPEGGHFLAKPFRASDLLDKVRRLIGASTSRRP